MSPLVASSTLLAKPPCRSLFASLAAVDSDASDHTSRLGSLSTIDDILFVLAVTILVLSTGWWFMRSRRDPLISAPERPNTIREDAVALAVVAYFLGAMVVSGLVRLGGGSADSVLGALVIGNGAHLAGIAACAYIAATRFDGGIAGFCCGRRRGELFTWIALVLGLSVVAIALCPLIRDATVSGIVLFMPGFEFQPHPTVVALHDPSQPIVVKVAFWTGATLIAPVAEEFFFRGLLQTFLVSIFRGRTGSRSNRWVAIVVAAILFGAVHYSQPSAIPALTVLAVLMGYVYEKTGALAWPIVIHAAFNAKTLVWDAIGGSVI